MRVFVSYRRSDAGGHAGRLCDDIAERLPDAEVFQDVESIAPGEDFLDSVRRAVLVAAAVLYATGRGDEQIAASAPTGTAGPAAVVPGATAAAVGSPGTASGEDATALSVPALARTIPYPSGGTGLEFQVLEAGVSESSLRLLLRISNHGAYGTWLGEGDVQLVADGRATNPRDYVGALEGRVDRDVNLDFDIAGEPRELALALRSAGAEGVTPLVPGPPPLDPPALDAIASLELGTSRFDIGPPAVDVLSDKLVLSVPVQLDNTSAYPVAFSDSEFRLVVDGSARAPVGDLLSRAVAGGAAETATLHWEVPFDADQLSLRITHQGAEEELPLGAG